jgi:hypothetical protein
MVSIFENWQTQSWLYFRRLRQAYFGEAASSTSDLQLKYRATAGQTGSYQNIPGDVDILGCKAFWLRASAVPVVQIMTGSYSSREVQRQGRRGRQQYSSLLALYFWL